VGGRGGRAGVQPCQTCRNSLGVEVGRPSIYNLFRHVYMYCIVCIYVDIHLVWTVVLLVCLLYTNSSDVMYDMYSIVKMSCMTCIL